MYLSNHATAEESSKAVASLIIHRINQFKPTQFKKFILCLPTGSTPLLVYEELARRCELGEISFKHVITINLDEYVGLAADHPQSYCHFMDENFFSKVDIPPIQHHLLPSNPIPPNKTHQDSCASYESLIVSKLGGIHLVFMGIGENGHIAFNEPCSSFRSRTRVVELDEGTREINARFFEDKSQVPTHALTMGIRTILDSQEIVVLANGDKKSNTIKMALEGGVNHLCPASILQTHGNVTFFTDEEASRNIEENTMKYLIAQPPIPSLATLRNNGNGVMHNDNPKDEDENETIESTMKRPNALRGSSFNLTLSPLSPKEKGIPRRGHDETTGFSWSRPSSPTKFKCENGSKANDLIADDTANVITKKQTNTNGISTDRGKSNGDLNDVNPRDHGNETQMKTLLSQGKIQIDENLDDQDDRADQDLNCL